MEEKGSIPWPSSHHPPCHSHTCPWCKPDHPPHTGSVHVCVTFSWGGHGPGREQKAHFLRPCRSLQSLPIWGGNGRLQLHPELPLLTSPDQLPPPSPFLRSAPPHILYTPRADSALTFLPRLLGRRQKIFLTPLKPCVQFPPHNLSKSPLPQEFLREINI